MMPGSGAEASSSVGGRAREGHGGVRLSTFSPRSVTGGSMGSLFLFDRVEDAAEDLLRVGVGGFAGVVAVVLAEDLARW